jgi:hypothetical protein
MLKSAMPMTGVDAAEAAWGAEAMNALMFASAVNTVAGSKVTPANAL